MKNFRLFGEWLLLFGATLVLVLTAWQQEWTHRLDYSLLDFASQYRLSEPSDDIVIIEIDDRALSEIGNWPWDRARHAELIDQLATYGPKLTVVDILFVDPSQSESDAQLSRSVAEADNVILAHAFAQQLGTPNQLVPVFPIPELANTAQGIGHVSVMPDSDGVVRRFELEFEAGGQQYDHLAKVVALSADAEAVELPQDTAEPIVPMHPYGSFVSYSAGDVVSGQASREFLADKIVLIGSTAQGLGDRYTVADHAGRIMSGVEMQANFLSAILQNELITDLDDWIVGGALIAAIALLFITFWQLPPVWGLRLSLALIAVLVALSTALVVSGQWMPVFPAILGVVVAYPLWGWRRLSAVSRFLEVEAQALMPRAGKEVADGSSGFDTVARQVSLMRNLIGETRERLAFLRKTLSASPDPMMVFDADDRAVLMNEQAMVIFGEESDWSGLTLFQLLAENRAQFDTKMEEITTADGREFLVASSEVEIDEQIKIITMRDITKIRESEQQRREMLEFLSHDMRSPQAAIVGLVGAAGKHLPEQERMERIEAQARRTLKLTDDFVQIARLEYEGIEPIETDIGALLHEASDRAYPLAKRKNIKLETSLPMEPVFCMVEAYSLSRAIDNLIGNALKFSSNGQTIKVALKSGENGNPVIEIVDEGPGLPPERVSDPFARFGARTKGAGPSAGLGLAYVKKVVDEHEAEIRVRTKSDGGTSFEIILHCEQMISD